MVALYMEFVCIACVGRGSQPFGICELVVNLKINNQNTVYIAKAVGTQIEISCRFSKDCFMHK